MERPWARITSFYTSWHRATQHIKNMLINLIPVFLELHLQLTASPNMAQIYINTAYKNRPKVFERSEIGLRDGNGRIKISFSWN